MTNRALSFIRLLSAEESFAVRTCLLVHGTNNRCRTCLFRSLYDSATNLPHVRWIQLLLDRGTPRGDHVLNRGGRKRRDDLQVVLSTSGASNGNVSFWVNRFLAANWTYQDWTAPGASKEAYGHVNLRLQQFDGIPSGSCRRANRAVGIRLRVDLDRDARSLYAACRWAAIFSRSRTRSFTIENFWAFPK